MIRLIIEAVGVARALDTIPVRRITNRSGTAALHGSPRGTGTGGRRAGFRSIALVPVIAISVGCAGTAYSHPPPWGTPPASLVSMARVIRITETVGIGIALITIPVRPVADRGFGVIGLGAWRSPCNAEARVSVARLRSVALVPVIAGTAALGGGRG